MLIKVSKRSSENPGKTVVVMRKKKVGLEYLCLWPSLFLLE